MLRKLLFTRRRTIRSESQTGSWARSGAREQLQLGTAIRWAEATYRRIGHVSGGGQRIDVSMSDERGSCHDPVPCSKPNYYFELAKIRLKYILKTGQLCD